VFAAEEDFGIAPVEAQAAGNAGDRLRPRVCGIDPRRDHARPTGGFSTRRSRGRSSTPCARSGSKPAISAGACRDNALRFAPARFRDEMVRIVDGTIAARARASAG
jgi:hypothetical protein